MFGIYVAVILGFIDKSFSRESSVYTISVIIGVVLMLVGGKIVALFSKVEINEAEEQKIVKYKRVKVVVIVVVSLICGVLLAKYMLG